MKTYGLTPEQQDEALRIHAQSLALAPYQAELIKLQQHIERHRLKMMVLFEGRDAAGKGTTIGSVSRFMNPKHYRIVALGKPTEEERSQWYFQRYIKHFPHFGELVLFDRSWYNRAMVEPVFGFCTPREHALFLKHVVPFEQALTEEGMLLVKLYFSVSKQKQALRFEQRRSDPLRRWKLSEIDMQAQSMWEQFTQMKYQMLTVTDHAAAPWHVIRSSDKHRARLETMKLLLRQVDYEGRDERLVFAPDPKVCFSGRQELALMEAHGKGYTS
ncbi:polyphosphate kinase 2 [Thiomicrolovo sp. ZZH C-3]